MRTMSNSVTINGRLYSHKLKLSTVSNPSSANFGKEFIMGSVFIAIDEEGANVIEVEYTYVTEVTGTGKINYTFSLLKEIIDDEPCWDIKGKDNAIIVTATPSIIVKDFYDVREDKMVSRIVCDGGFLSKNTSLLLDEKRNTFKVDMLLTKVTMIEPNGESVLEPYLKLKGAIFNFRKQIFPVDNFVVKNSKGFNTFLSQNISSQNPVLMTILGRIDNMVVKKEKIEGTDFDGSNIVTYTEHRIKEWRVTGTGKETLQYGMEGILTENEVIKAMQDRDLLLAGVKQKRLDYEASKNNSQPSGFGSGNGMNSPIQNGAFNFI